MYLIFFLFDGFSVILEISISPYKDIIIVLGIGVADINKTSQFFPPFFAKSDLCFTPNLCCSSITTNPNFLNFIFFEIKREFQ